MAEAIDLHDGIGRKELRAIQRRFHAVQRERLRRILGELKRSHQDFIHLLPLLFHINHPMLPGYVNKETPAGISSFSPTQQMLRIARKISRSFSYQKRALRRYRIHAVYLMGSMGTIGQSTGSDFDVWLCHDPNLTGPEKDLLQQKVARVEDWASKLGMEVHVFVMDAEGFRYGKKSRLSRDSSGSTQHSLLLEEFYRTGVLLAGRYPLWWLVPPDEEHNYPEFSHMLLVKRFVDSRECLDFGGLEYVPASEFFGAALWHLFKGIESPYKAVLKIFLMEAYSQTHPLPNLLAQQAKAAIYAGETDIVAFDSYLIMYRHVERYLLERRQYNRLELARRCLYFKVGERLSRKQIKRNWRAEIMLGLTREWGWGQAQLITLDSRSAWKIDRVLEERNALVQELSRSYRMLTDYARANSDSNPIDPAELNLLGRKLYTALERRPGKIERINPGISLNLTEPYLSLHYRPSKAGDTGWFLYRGKVDQELVSDSTPIKTTICLIEMLAWCQLNGLCSEDTILGLYPEDCPVSPWELHQLLYNLRRLYPVGNSFRAPMRMLSERARTVSMALFVNIGADPMEHLTKEGKQLTSNRSDAFSFGSARANLVVNLEQLVQTSWGEVLAYSRQGVNGIFDALCQFLNTTIFQYPDEPAAPVSAYSFSSIRAPQIARRVSKLFGDTATAFGNRGLDARYIIQVEESFYRVQVGEQGFDWLKFDTEEDLLEELAEPQQIFRPALIDANALSHRAYPVIMGLNQPDLLQLFYFRKGEQTEIYILDQKGALFRQSLATNDVNRMLIQQYRFLSSMLRLEELLAAEGSENGLLLAEPLFYQLRKDHDGNWIAESRGVPKTIASCDYLDLRLVTEFPGGLERPFTLVCDEREFHSMVYGDDLYAEAVKYIWERRLSNHRYPVYLTAVEFSPGLSATPPAGIELLNLKKHLEHKLNIELSHI